MSTTPLTVYRPGLAVGRDAQVLHRAATPEFYDWLEHTRTAGGCARPIRLTGTIAAVDAGTGRITGRLYTDELPDRALYKACGNRRESQCPYCAWVYQGDAFQVVRCGLTGGKGVPASVGWHPIVFATFTAPSFGAVHHRHVARHTCRSRQRCDCRPAPCRARSNAGTCQHGQPAACFARHDADDPRLGQPLCLDCYDHAASRCPRQPPGIRRDGRRATAAAAGARPSGGACGPLRAALMDVRKVLPLGRQPAGNRSGLAMKR